MQDVQVGVGDDVGRHREREEQAAVEKPAARESRRPVTSHAEPAPIDTVKNADAEQGAPPCPKAGGST